MDTLNNQMIGISVCVHKRNLEDIRCSWTAILPRVQNALDDHTLRDANVTLANT